MDIRYHSFYLLHQYLIDPNKGDIFWNNAVGVDFSNKEIPINKRAIFYRTGLAYSFYMGNLKLALNPYLQIGITPYTKKYAQDTKVMRPFSFGLNIQIPLNFTYLK